ncbi:MAG TPA: tryptophan synthase subunit alpha [Polyangiaceae bacterium]|nr:tryptophan synthase subunit alpha [Polyangiaceae bacterium]
MTRLSALFGGDRKVLISYLCVGDPSVEESVELARACVRAGADVLELGVPFSDPTADGPAIARASERAIAAGGGIDATLRVAGAIRASDPRVGLVLFGYYNPIFVRGEARAVRDAADVGIDALLVVDLPVGEAGPLLEAARTNGVGFVPLLAPTSRAERVATATAVARHASVPFIYYVSITGITGSGAVDAKEAGFRAAEVRKQTGCPVVVGFGIDSGAKARDAAQRADGVVVGTALVRAIEQGRTSLDRRKAVEHLVRELRLSIDGN